MNIMKVNIQTNIAKLILSCVQNDFLAGVIMYILSCGKAPFKGKSSEDTIELIRAGKYCVRAEEWTSLCDDVRDVVQGLLQTDPADRLTAKEALEQDLFEDFRSADAGGLGMDRGATKDLVFI